MVRPEDGFQYYTYDLLYVDDILCISHNGVQVLEELDYYFNMKPGSIEGPYICLGGKMHKTILPNGVKVWGISPSKYVQEAVRNLEAELEEC